MDFALKDHYEKGGKVIVPLWKRARPDLSGGIRGGFKTGFQNKE
jgi:hypothetical protein